MNRRSIISGLGVLGLVVPASIHSLGATQTNMDTYNLSHPPDLLKANVKLRGSLDTGLVIWWIKATQYAVIDTVLTPLFHLQNASFQRFENVSDNTYAITMLELAYFTDLETGAVLEEFRNPFTDQVGRVPPELFGPNQVFLTLDGLQPPEHFPFGTLTFEGQLGPGYSDGEMVWVHEETLVRMTSDNPAYGNYIYNELVSYQGRVADLNNPAIKSMEATLNYNTTSNWRPWMMPGDTPGHIMAQGFGKKVRRIDDLPTDYLAMARQHHPEVIANPEAFMVQRPVQSEE